MVASLGFIVASLLQHIVPRSFMATNLIVTSAGIISGAALLLTVPIDYKCLVLTAYLAAFIAVQVYVSRRNQRLSLVSSSVS